MFDAAASVGYYGVELKHLTQELILDFATSKRLELLQYL